MSWAEFGFQPTGDSGPLSKVVSCAYSRESRREFRTEKGHETESTLGGSGRSRLKVWTNERNTHNHFLKMG